MKSLRDKINGKAASWGYTVEELGLSEHLVLAESSEEFPDSHLEELLEMKLAELDYSFSENPFLQPDANSGLDQGDVKLAASFHGLPVNISFAGGRPNQVQHLAVSGITGSGKTIALSGIAKKAAPQAFTLIVDANGSFASLRDIRDSHQIVCLNQLRLNPFDFVESLSAELIDQAVVREISQTFGLQFGAIELLDVIREIRRKGKTPCLPDIIRQLKFRTYKGFSKRSQYRDSALLVLENLLHATHGLFNCQEGMSLQDILLNGQNLVLLGEGFLPDHLAFIVRYIFEYFHLLTLTRKNFSKPVLFVLDEGQTVSRQQNFSEKLLQLRHYGIHMLAGFQNASSIPLDFLGNCDGLLAFQTTDARDRRIIAANAKLTDSQEKSLAKLQPGECVCYFPRFNWKHAFPARCERVT